MKTYNIRNWVLLNILVLLVSTSFSQDKNEYDELKKYIEESRQLFDVPGFAVGIFKDNKVVFNEGFGLRNTSSGDEVNSSTIFGIASCSKAFTAACIAILVDDGILNWTDKVIDHYPEFKLADPYVTKEMQVQDLLCHRSGLKTFDGDLLWYGTNYTSEEVVKRISNRELSYSFRSTFGYQNVMYIAAGQLIKEVSGKTWDQFISEKIFNPLELNSTSTTNSGLAENMNVALPHLDGKPMSFINYDNCGPAASINTSSDDLLKWIEMLLNKGSYNEKQIISEEQYYKVTNPLTLLNAGKAEEINGTHFYTYGLGWFMFDYEGRKIIQHGGGLPGFHSKIVLIPEENMGFVVLSNQISGLVEATYKKILDFHLNDDNTDWAAMYLKNEQARKAISEEKDKEKIESRELNTSPALKLKKYTGMYEDKLYGKASVEEVNGELKITLLPTATLFTSAMEHWQNETFKIRFNDPFLPGGYLTFNHSNEGDIEYFTIDLENPDFHFYKLKFYRLD